ncbi:MAG: glycyl-radical enzyme activating protein [bacterium]
MGPRVLVTDIQRFCVNDGPGFRTNVYLKGCMLRCAWCHNPETIAPHPDLYWKRRLCVQCGACLEACPRDAIRPPVPPEEAQQDGSTYHKIDRVRCDRCMKCVEACLYGALEIAGKPMTVSEVIDEVERDKPFYDNSGGGMTLSGGEPTFHAEFSRELLREARARGIHVCLDTNGCCEWDVLAELAEATDVVLFDLKHLDSGMHKEKTGAGNEAILRNLGLLAGAGKPVWVRIPVVPGYNDSLAFHERASGFLAGLGGAVQRIDLLPFHNWCQDKYGWLGLDWDLKETEALESTFVEVLLEPYREKGLQATVGGSGFEGKS